ncbi:alpha/beta hydrolase [Nonomuraea sediminis]|uniref:alpha/beta hydrolase n=1 Tax=Nonomuraea sediminis TaxID=2835864 RepID=UPI001BDC8308|nr:alpha/beta hydrolase [Nonomuraea sediminis]
MAEYTAAQAAFGQVAALAAGHHADLDQPVRLMQAHTWVGGGAPAFAADLAAHRAALQSALTDALRSLADLVVRHGGPPPAVPVLTTSVTTMSPAPSGYQGIDPHAMTALISTLDHASHTLPAAGTRLSSALSAQGLSPQPGRTLARIAQWTATTGTDLRRRLTRIQRTVPWTTLPASVAAYDLFASAASAPLLTGVAAGDPAASAPLLAGVAAGDPAAVQAMLAVQERGKDPTLAARINAWWHTLSPGLQRSLLEIPAFGLLNGLPATARDQANRHWLSIEKTRLTQELDATDVRANPSLLGAWERISNELRRLTLIEQTLHPVHGFPPPMLLSFNPTGQGRLILSWGNPDTADTTITSVSGLSSQLDSVHGDLERSRSLWQQATKTSGDHTVAAITWYGYDAPQLDPGLLDPGRSVASSSAATKGGAALAAFQDGLHAAHAPSSTARAVIVGHSYGSLTTGHAATLRPGKLADDLILIGSPGVDVHHASDLGLDSKHVWVGEAGGDPVAALGRFKTDPGHKSFGATPFPVGRQVWTSAHSSYWDRASPSLRNMGRIINGQYDKLTSPEPLNQHPQLLMPELAPDLVQPPER